MADPRQVIEDKLSGKDKGRPITESDIPEIHDILMSEYGWIPIQQFKELPIPTLWSLLACIRERKLKEKEYNDREVNRNKPRSSYRRLG